MIHSAGHPPFNLSIGYLADHPEVLGSLAAGFKAQWPDHFSGQPVDAIKIGFASCCRDQGLPLTIVAMIEQTFGGTASLRGESGTVCPDLGPWLTHLYVEPSVRNHGIGSTLIRAIESEALRQGFSELYAATSRAATVFERMGWCLAEKVEHQSDIVSVLRKELTLEAST